MLRMNISLAIACVALLLMVPGPAGKPQRRRDRSRTSRQKPQRNCCRKKKDVVVLDIRTTEEFASGHIPGAKNLDFFDKDFAKEVAALEKDKTYLVHCASGGRSTKALKHFEEQKLPSVFHLNGGFKAWEAAGKPVEKK
jgi:rhodanese-related sulfurtransferase